jgi:hypothetical protein
VGGGRQLVAAVLPRRALHKSVRDHGEGSQNVPREQSMIAAQAAADVSLNLISYTNAAFIRRNSVNVGYDFR